MFTGQSLLFSLLITIGLFFLPGYCYSEDAPVKVNRVKFSRENILGLNNWYEIALELEGGRVPGVDTMKPRFFNNVRVRLSLCYEVNSITGNDYQYFQSTVKIISLEKRNKKVSYFYLPPEIIQRDRLDLNPFAYLVEIDIEGTPLALGGSLILKHALHRKQQKMPACCNRFIIHLSTICVINWRIRHPIIASNLNAFF